MSVLLTEPGVGLVIRYAYLWRATRRGVGRVEGSKDRPCVVILAVRKDGGRTSVIVVPVTHSPPGTRGQTLLRSQL